MGGWWRMALVSPDEVALSRMVGVSPSVNLSLHHKVQKFYSGTGSPGWSRENGSKTVVMVKRLWYGGKKGHSDIQHAASLYWFTCWNCPRFSSLRTPSAVGRETHGPLVSADCPPHSSDLVTPLARTSLTTQAHSSSCLPVFCSPVFPVAGLLENLWIFTDH